MGFSQKFYILKLAADLSFGLSSTTKSFSGFEHSKPSSFNVRRNSVCGIAEDLDAFSLR